MIKTFISNNMKNQNSKYLIGGLIGAIVVVAIVALGSSGKLFQGSLTGAGTISSTPNLVAQDPAVLALQSRVTLLEQNQPGTLSQINALNNKITTLTQSQTSLVSQTKTLSDKITFIQSGLSCVRTIPYPLTGSTLYISMGNIQAYLAYLGSCLLTGSFSAYSN